jgi:uncharacterized protein YqjF (DUF2071 family)
LPSSPWTLAQTCRRQLFVHERVAPESLRPLIPDALALDLHEGSAYLGVTAFEVEGVRLRGMLPLPFASGFLQVNVRTYVSAEDKPGIWFFSLDATSALAVEVARRLYGAPFFQASIAARSEHGWTALSCARVAGNSPAVLELRFRPTGRAARPQPGTIEHFLAERYCLYAAGRGGRLRRAEIHHRPWRLRGAELEGDLNTMAPGGIEPLAAPPLAWYSESQDILLWSPRPVAAGSGAPDGAPVPD